MDFSLLTSFSGYVSLSIYIKGQSSAYEWTVLIEILFNIICIMRTKVYPAQGGNKT